MRDGRFRGNRPATVNPLTAREMELLAMLARGSPMRAICDAFDITERSARAHIQMIVEKLGVKDSRGSRCGRFARWPRQAVSCRSWW